MNVFIFHGTMGSPEANWFPWLERELKSLGIEVFVPKFPTPEGQSLENWLKAFEPYQDKVNGETVFVGHSMGPGFFLRLLERRTSPIKTAILAAPFDGFIGEEPYDTLNKTFIDHPFDFVKIKQNCHQFVVMVGDDDPYVAIKFPQRIADNLGVKLQIIKGGKHLNSEAGYTKFPEALEEIKKLI
ncbi:MAG: alpha/beta hydrolase [Candidatus Beckwithbacteria bacterium]|nr:alpha/beta hydrolase [Candidatus Beckwithbacteria bacterium]